MYPFELKPNEELVLMDDPDLEEAEKYLKPYREFLEMFPPYKRGLENETNNRLREKVILEMCRIQMIYSRPRYIVKEKV